MLEKQNAHMMRQIIYRKDPIHILKPDPKPYPISSMITIVEECQTRNEGSEI
jgi:hypothetical protein